ncbi:hypothetical protein FGB62_381g02 [Gracilaria domingensis]|nr:hypothetical protein FGB62_479g01 [Gracilaria domingensis]KAI0556884.1 hypothetical protein FGB62_381g02 [Gracilaria domingensis]
MRFSHGDVKSIKICHAKLGTHSSSGSPNDEGEIVMSDMSLSRALLHHTIGSGYIRLQSASVEDFEIQSSRICGVTCHEENKAGAIPKTKISLQTEMFKNVSFTDGFYCDRTEISALDLLDVKIKNYIDMSKSDITDPVSKNVTAYMENVCSPFSLADAIVDCKTVAVTNTTKVTMAGTKFLEGIMFMNISISSKDIDPTGTIFSQEIINKEYCALSCLESG